MAHLGVTFRIIPTPQQERQLAAIAGACRAVWNAALEQRQHAWNRCRKSVGYVEQAKDLTEARAEFAFLARCPVSALQQTLRDLDKAYMNWWRGRGCGPKWKSAKRSTPRFRVTSMQVRMGERHVVLGKVGLIRARVSRELPGRILNATFARRGEHWYVSFCCEVPDPTPGRHSGPDVGVDLGITQSVTLSTGEHFDLPKISPREYTTLKRWQRRLARRKKGSRGHRQARRRISRWYEHHANRRQDFAAKTATTLATHYGVIAIEDLAVERMTRRARGKGRAVKAALNRAIQHQAWGALRARLEQKAKWTGAIVITVDPKYTSQTCNNCGHVAKENRESQASFRCASCGHEAHADVNAAKNILSRAGQARTHAGGVACLERATLNPEAYFSSTES